MELRHIRYFLELAEELNFSRAAEKLHIAQPHLSRQIKELEEDLGAPLFFRTSRQVELTNAGKVFLKRAYRILDQVEQARISTRLSSTGREGEFRIGFTGAIQDLIPTFKRYRKQFPQVGLVFQHMSAAEQIEALNDYRIDVAAISVPVHDDRIEVMPITKLPFKVALYDTHPLVSKPTIQMKDLEYETLIMTPKSAGTLYYETVMAVFQQAKITPRVTIQAHDLQTVLSLVAAKMGLAITPSPIGPYASIVKRDIEGVHFMAQATVAWRKDNQSEILQQFLTFFKEFHANYNIFEYDG